MRILLLILELNNFSKRELFKILLSTKVNSSKIE